MLNKSTTANQLTTAKPQNTTTVSEHAGLVLETQQYIKGQNCQKSATVISKIN